MSEVALGLGVVSFDGRVLEFFGFGEQGSRRIHLWQIGGIGYNGQMLSVDVGRGGIGIRMAMGIGDAEHAALQSLITEVRTAAGLPA